MNKRLLVTIAVSILFISAWTWFGNQMGYNKPRLKPKPVAEQAAQDPASSEQAAPAAIATSEEAAAAQPEVLIEKRADILANDLMDVHFSNEGGVITNVRLKHYFHDKAQTVPIELAFPQTYYPGQVLMGDLSKPISDRLWRYQVTTSANQIQFVGSKNGVQISKTFGLDANYKLRCDVKVAGAASNDFHLVLAEGLQPIAPGEELEVSFFSMGAVNPRSMTFSWSEQGDHEDEIIEKMTDTLAPKLKENSEIEWVGVKDNYFASIFMPDQPLNNFYKRVTGLYPGDDLVKLPVVAVGGKDHVQGTFYMGPLVSSITEVADPRLDNLITYGIAGKLSKWLYYGLELAHKITGNWGWAIVLLTLCIRALMIPLTIPQVKSSIKMRAIAPEIEKIKLKYPGSDLESKQKLSQATFEIYKREGVNPFSSCVTVLLQMPIFIAYFSLLRNTMSLRQAEWFGWITDLSASDPYFVLPILTGLTMFLTSLAMHVPSTADPVQAKMMKYMPVFFSLFFVFMPSGLTLYMVTSNIFSLAQTKALEWRYGNK